MILATHAIVGAAVAHLFPHHPVIGFLLACASHFVLDAIPHWDYHLRSLESKKEFGRGRPDMAWGRDFFIDLSKIALDGVSGVGVAFLLFRPQSWHDVLITLVGIAGGVLPDVLQFLYWKLGGKPLAWAQWVHDTFHFKKSIESPIIGASLQIVFVGILFEVVRVIL